MPHEDVRAAPRHVVAEVIAGELCLRRRPCGAHLAAATALGEELGPPFKRGKGGPGGWILLDQPELHLADDIFVPDLAGWRRTTMDHLPNAPCFEVRPDWVCEVLSPSTERVDRSQKLRIYAREGVAHAWLVNPLQRTLEVLRRHEQGWLTIAVHCDDTKIRAEPFDAIELDLSVLWADVVLDPNPSR